MLRSPSLDNSPCARCADTPAKGRAVSISKLNQYSVSSRCGLPSSQIAPSYFPEPSACCTVLATRASVCMGGNLPMGRGLYGQKS